MRALLRRLPPLAACCALALALTACGDDEPADAGSGPTSTTTADPGESVAAQAQAILDCTTAQGLPGQLTEAAGGVTAVDLTTSDETIVVHVLESAEEAQAHQSSSSLAAEVVGNTVVLGGAISAEHHSVIVGCIQDL
ncbi:hypothetical protein [Nocardioides sp. MH1]|uniref:hypothetical protein n=1 Tax=Nocardioides sp. MH1 TaxID=3242490 RepID=UPI003521C23D